MKKFMKFLGTVATLTAVAAGCAVIYKKYFAPEEDFDDFEDEFEDDFEEDLDAAPERGYVSLSPSEEASEQAEAAEAEAKEDAAEAE